MTPNGFGGGKRLWDRAPKHEVARFPEMFKEVLPVARKHQKEVVYVGFLLWTGRNFEKHTLKGWEGQAWGLLPVTELKGLTSANEVWQMTSATKISKSFWRNKQNLVMGHVIAMVLKKLGSSQASPDRCGLLVPCLWAHWHARIFYTGAALNL